MAPPRILLCGDVFGRLNQLFKRVLSVNKSAGPFDALLCVGQFFPDSDERLEEFMDYVDGRSPIPIPTYFIGDYGVGAPKVLSAASRNSANLGFKMDGFRICDNLYWLRGSGKFTLHGLSVMYLSGKESWDGPQFGVYSQDDVDALRALAEEPGIVDLFLTNEWPSGVTNGASISDIPAAASDSTGCNSAVSVLVAEIKPRYHIAGTKGIFYAREPYSNDGAVHVTRFLGLASVGNKDKQKFIHAISPTPASTMSASEISAKPPNSTLSPYTSTEPKAQHKEITKRVNDDLSDSQYWRYDVSKKRQKSGTGDGDKPCFKFIYSGSCPRGEKCSFQHDMDGREQYLRGVCIDFLIKGKCERGPDCTFKHSLQEEGESHSHRRYGLKDAKRSKECWFCLSSPNVELHLVISIGESYYCALAKGPLVQDHVLLVPIEHSPNTLSLPEECDPELVRFQSSLKLYFKNQGNDVVFFEWVARRGTHANLQSIPVPSSRVAAIDDIFHLAAKRLSFKFTTMKFQIGNQVPPYFNFGPKFFVFTYFQLSNLDDGLYIVSDMSLFDPNSNVSIVVSDNSNGRKWLREQFDKNYNLFYVELPGGTILLHSVDESESFPVQFGREVLAGLLNMPERADWRKCTLSKEEETKMTEEFKKRFEEVDPNR